MREARFFEQLADERVRCTLCALDCRIRAGGRGACGVRVNRGGTLFTLVDDRVAARHVDPIEKKPLFHFLPGHTTYSLGTVGCNFRCLHCQNFTLSRSPDRAAPAWDDDPDPVCATGVDPEALGERITPRALVRAAVDAGCASVAFTYNEPTIFFELALETAQRARAAGLKSVFVTNGSITAEPLAEIAPYLDAANIDLKGFDPAAHRRMTGAALQPVLDGIRRYRAHGIWVEVTTLVIPDHNDSETQLAGIAAFIRDIDPDIPWHVTRFHPTFRLMDRRATPVATLRRARRIGLAAGLRHVYTGNAPGEDGEQTRCHACDALVLRRFGLGLRENRLVDGRCPDCGATIPGIF